MSSDPFSVALQRAKVVCSSSTKPFERSTRRSLFSLRAVRLRFTSRTCSASRIRRPPLAWLVSERSLYHDVRILSLLGLTRPLPSVFSDPSYPLARVWDYLSMSSVAWFDDVCFYEVSVLPPLASTEIGVVQVGRFRVCCWKSLEIHGADSIGIHSGTKKATTPEGRKVVLLHSGQGAVR